MASLLRRAMGAKSLTLPWRQGWDVDSLRYGLAGTGSAPGRERITTDFPGYVEGIYKRSGPVSSLMNVRLHVFTEARFQFQRMAGGRPGDLFGSPALSVLDAPWPNGTTGDLLAKMIQDVDLAGNAYIAKQGGRLRRLRPDWVTIVATSKTYPDSPWSAGFALDAEVTAYIYDPPSGDTQLLAAADVAHFAPVPDPDADWRGMSWLTPVLREISADNAATRHKLKFFENGGSPKLVASLDASVTKDQFERFKAMMTAEHSGVDHAYSTMYLGGGADVKVVGADLKQLDFSATQGAGESRLAAAAGVPPSIVGFSEGLSGSALNAGNYASARRRMADGTMRPLWRSAAGALSTLVTVPGGSRLWYDDRDIAFLREDRADAAQIQATQASSIRQLIDAGYDPDAAVTAVISEDFGRLVDQHTGLFSVQLQPPGNGEMNEPPPPPAPEPADPSEGN